jgi:hypothetical protein
VYFLVAAARHVEGGCASNALPPRPRDVLRAHELIRKDLAALHEQGGLTRVPAFKIHELLVNAHRADALLLSGVASVAPASALWMGWSLSGFQRIEVGARCLTLETRT